MGKRYNSIPNLDKVLHSLSHPTRRRIFEYACTKDLQVDDLTFLLNERYHGIYKHLSVLIEDGLIESTADGKHRYYAAKTNSLIALEAWTKANSTIITQRM